MNKTERLNRIFDIVKRENGVPIQVLARHLDVSHMTIRRDLESLVDDNLVKLIHGGVILNPELKDEKNDDPYSLNVAGSVHAEEKRKIGALAASLVETDDTLIVDSGSTTEYLAKSLPQDRRITVITYALNIVTDVASLSNVRLVCPGGIFHSNALMFESPEGRELIERHRATKAFISAAGVHNEFGVTCSNAYERDTKRSAIDSSAKKILIADSSKFGVIRSDYFADLDAFDLVVTDDRLQPSFKNYLEELGIEVLLA